MTNRFFLSVDNATAAQQDIVTNWLRSTHLGFWHHLSHAWLVIDRRDVYSVDTLRDQLTQLVPNVSLIVMGIDNPFFWAGFGPTPNFTWLHEVWEKD